ncbi:MAG: Exoenzyme S synthesis regulatory protein ExsA [Firmicutes bacterium ADurb.Bin146]|nr:MAG: Exoenzyme S synthesis regulatory protein ExsA [Firmicutes bacterium ADurb.Bin146]
MIIQNIRHEWPEKAGFLLDRPNGPDEYIFLHYFNSVDLLCGNEVIRTKPHACIVVSAKKPQWFRSEQKLVHDWFHFSGEVGENMQKYNLSLDKVYYPFDSLEITETVRKMESEFFTGTEYSKRLCELYIEQIFIMMARSDISSSLLSVKKQISDKVEQVRKKMFTSPSEDWPVKKMAKLAGLSESRFYTVYKSVYKVTPNRDLIIARIEKAKNLLQTEGFSVNETADALGYSSVYHFIRQFKNITGITPGRIRK